MKKRKNIFAVIAAVVSAAAVINAAIAFLGERAEERKTRGKAKKHKPRGIYERFVKRPLDCFLGTAALIILSPVYLIIALLVRINLGAPVLFTQERPGRDGKLFKLYKFRTMIDKRDENGNMLLDEHRLTKFGRMLRASSLDELPELVNIIKGDMSVVGPRPLLARYLTRYNEHQARRHEVRPGFTGLAQVHGRNDISWENKFNWDVKYVDNITFIGDCEIVLRTIETVLKREGISAAGEATTSEFMGNEEPAENSGEVQESLAAEV